MSEPLTDVNMRYLAHYVTGRGAGRVLDYGCGSGELVGELRSRGVDCHGAEVFYEGAAYPGEQLRSLLDEGVIRHFEEGAPIPFDDASFDLVISNQVLEHVSDLRATATELDRVLKPDGVMYHHFPSRAVLREGHIGIPLAHRLRPGSLRFAYTLALRSVGLGYNKSEGPVEWTRRKLDWLDRYTFYRPYSEVVAAFRGYRITGREADYCRFRAEGRRFRPLLSRFDRLQGILFRRLAFMALEMRRTTPTGGRVTGA